LLSWASVQSFTDTPGDPHNVVYGNDGYMILGEVVRKLAGTADLSSALQTLVCAPLGMKNTVGSRSLVKDQTAGEARYHNRLYKLDSSGNPSLVPLTVGPSLLSEDQPLVPNQYGNWWEYETGQGCGGMSSAVIDMARIIAMFNTGGLYPVLSAEAINALLTNAFNATANLSGPDAHGYHGLDWCVMQGSALRAQKGGWIPSHQTVVDFVTQGGCGLVLAINGNTRNAATYTVNGNSGTWIDKLYDIAYNTDWGDIDLFQSKYGMKSLTPVKVKPVPMQAASAKAVQLTSETLAQEVSAMTRAAAKHANRPRVARTPVPRGPGPITLTRPTREIER
jgi:CubicO group peptidase (beta-lactamase class C family)